MQRRAEFVRHIAQEFAFDLVGLLRACSSACSSWWVRLIHFLLQRFVGPHQLAVALADFAQHGVEGAGQHAGFMD